MANRLLSLFLVGALLSMAFQETLRAEEEPSEIPSGYEEAGQAEEHEENAHTGIAVPVGQPLKQEAKEEKKEIDPQVKALADQMQGQLKHFFSAELNFAKEVCEPNPEQLQEMASLANPALRKAIIDMAVQQVHKMGGGGIRFGGGQKKQKDIRDRFETAALRIVEQVFPEDTITLYQEEQKYRKEFRSRAGAMALVSHLDSTFRLTQQQRERLTDSLQEVWQRNWEPYLQFMVHNPQFFPPIPDEVILPHLNKTQKKQWRSWPHQEIGFGWQHLQNRQRLLRDIGKGFDWFEEAKVDGKAAVIDKGVAMPAMRDIVREEEADEEQEESTDES